MAHYIAEQITTAESAEESDREAREHEAAESILALWQRRAGLPVGRPPMYAFERVFLALDRLAEPQQPWHFYRLFPDDAEPSPEDVVSSTLLSLALSVEDSARAIVRALVAEAAVIALDGEAEWVRLAENLAEDEERQAIRHLSRLMRTLEERNDAPEATEPLDRIQAHIARAISELTEINDTITDIRQGE